jgi:hypothetical protein
MCVPLPSSGRRVLNCVGWDIQTCAGGFLVARGSVLRTQDGRLRAGSLDSARGVRDLDTTWSYAQPILTARTAQMSVPWLVSAWKSADVVRGSVKHANIYRCKYEARLWTDDLGAGALRQRGSVCGHKANLSAWNPARQGNPAWLPGTHARTRTHTHTHSTAFPGHDTVLCHSQHWSRKHYKDN